MQYAVSQIWVFAYWSRQDVIDIYEGRINSRVLEEAYIWQCARILQFESMMFKVSEFRGNLSNPVAHKTTKDSILWIEWWVKVLYSGSVTEMVSDQG